jgi:hypothetical protein
MKTKAITAAAALLALGLMTQSGFAQQGQQPDYPMWNENATPAPNSDAPNDPSANDPSAAGAPASPQGQYQLKREGSDKATSGQDSGTDNSDKN